MKTKEKIKKTTKILGNNMANIITVIGSILLIYSFVLFCLGDWFNGCYMACLSIITDFFYEITARESKYVTEIRKLFAPAIDIISKFILISIGLYINDLLPWYLGLAICIHLGLYASSWYYFKYIKRTSINSEVSNLCKVMMLVVSFSLLKPFLTIIATRITIVIWLILYFGFSYQLILPEWIRDSLEWINNNISYIACIFLVAVPIQYIWKQMKIHQKFINKQESSV